MDGTWRVPWRARENEDPGGDGQTLQSVFAWLAAGAVTLGLGLAVVGGAAVAAADTGSESGASSSSSSSSDSGKSGSDAATKKSESEDSGTTAGSDKDSDSDPAPARADDDDESSTDRADKRDHKRSVSAKASAESDSDSVTQADAETAPADSVGSSDVPDSAGTAPIAHSNDATETADLTTQAPRAPPVSAATADDVEQASPWHTAWEDFVRRLQYTFFNKSPTMAPDNGTQFPSGHFGAMLNGQSNNGYALTYTVTEGPKHGTVEIDQARGLYVYTPSTRDARITDSFVITADNGAAAKLPGLAGAVQESLHAFAQRLGIAKADTVSVTIVVKSWFPNATSGDPSNSRYWAEQNYQDCVLMSVAMITGQLIGVEPDDWTERAIIEEASRTPSVAPWKQGQMMWTSSSTEVAYVDGEELLKIHGFDTEMRYYSDVKYQAGTYAQGVDALADLKTDLAAGKGVFVSVHGNAIWTAEQPGPWSGTFFGSANHAIVVLAVDQTRGIVWINDSGLKEGQIGKGAAISLGAFMHAWSAGGYLTVSASVKVPAEQEERQLVAA